MFFIFIKAQVGIDKNMSMKFKIILLIFFLIGIVTYSQIPSCLFDSNRQGMLIYHGDTPGNRFTGYGEAPNNYGTFVTAGNIKYNTLTSGFAGVTVLDEVYNDVKVRGLLSYYKLSGVTSAFSSVQNLNFTVSLTSNLQIPVILTTQFQFKVST